ncbi:IclR family transcriptional regulator [Tsukamurella sputi]|uniref:IclR family transcriptional regulator n=1 Tax=Tsukamurella sputi TaxID=2591848 RepID=A0A5C5RIJ4_9ACTN|nr:IclR family transcriptional regulator [Tsukamurella sputi]TWS21935.1 IclR family transcriptional regulator [Tsukamurella sputi]
MENSGVQTVARAFEILGCFRDGDALGVSEVARRCGLAVSTTHRLMGSLVAAGFLDKDGSRYRVGGALTEFGQLAHRQYGAYRAEPHLELLATTVGANASIAIRQAGDAVLVATSRWREADGDRLQGIRLPVHASALGKALLVWGETTEDLIDLLPYEGGTDRSVTGPDELAAELDRTRRRGYAFNDEELDVGFRTIGLPVLRPDGTCRFALGLRGPVALMTPERVPMYVELARSTARDIADALA